MTKIFLLPIKRPIFAAYLTSKQPGRLRTFINLALLTLNSQALHFAAIGGDTLFQTDGKPLEPLNLKSLLTPRVLDGSIMDSAGEISGEGITRSIDRLKSIAFEQEGVTETIWADPILDMAYTAAAELYEAPRPTWVAAPLVEWQRV